MKKDKSIEEMESSVEAEGYIRDTESFKIRTLSLKVQACQERLGTKCPECPHNMYCTLIVELRKSIAEANVRKDTK